MHLDPASLSLADRYKLLIGCVTPRPIAWVSTISPPDAPCGPGRPNLAPFSFFNAVGAEPMTLLFCPANKGDGSEKDSLRNAKPVAEGGTGEFVVCVVSEDMARPMAACAADLPYGQSEFDLAGLRPEPSLRVRPARVAGVPVAFECLTTAVIRLAPGLPSGGNIVLGRVVSIHAADHVLNERLHADPAAIRSIGRLGGSTYCSTRQRFDIPLGRSALHTPDPLPPAP